MNKNQKCFWVDIVNFIVSLGLVISGILIKYVLPRGSGRPRGGGAGFHGGREVITWLGMDRHEWGEIHFWLGIIFAVLVIIHLTQHARWIKNQFFSGKQNGEECS